MKIAQAGGFLYTPFTVLPEALPKPTPITVRTETAGGFSTLSLADDDKGYMVQVAVTPEVKRLLKALCK